MSGVAILRRMDSGATLVVAYREHRPYLALSAGLFVAGFLAGVALFLQGIDLFAALGIGSFESLIPENVTAASILANNTRAFALMVVGVLTFGLLTVFGLVFNGLVIGYVAGAIAARRGIGFVLAGILPHGVLELPALFAAGAVAFRVVVRVRERIFGPRDRVMSGPEWRRTGAFVVAAWVLLLVAAVVEFYVTGALLNALFGSGG